MGSHDVRHTGFPQVDGGQRDTPVFGRHTHFGLSQTVRERVREREKQSSLFDSRDFVGRISLGQELKLIYATRATRGYQNHKIHPRSKVRVFTKTKKRWCPVKSHHLR